MHTTLIFIFTLLLTTPLQALLVDNSGYAIETTYRDGAYFFARCRYEASANPRLSACQELHTEGLRTQDFALLQQHLQTNAEHAEHNAARWHKIKWGLLAVTTVSVLLTVRKLYKEKVLRMLGDACCDGHHHHHGWWERVSSHFPRLDLAGARQFFFREQTWRVPTFVAQVLAIVLAEQKRQAANDKQVIYDFLQTEILQLSHTQSKALLINVRSLTAIEFMLYEILRLRQAQLEEQTPHR